MPGRRSRRRVSRRRDGRSLPTSPQRSTCLNSGTASSPYGGARLGGETTGHPTTRVILANCAEAAPNRYPFFVDYFSCGLCPPFSDFFNDIMHTFGFHLLDLTPNVVACLACFSHLSEGFVGVVDSIDLDKGLVRVTVSMMGKEVPVELELTQVQTVG